MPLFSPCLPRSKLYASGNCSTGILGHEGLLLVQQNVTIGNRFSCLLLHDASLGIPPTRLFAHWTKATNSSEATAHTVDFRPRGLCQNFCENLLRGFSMFFMPMSISETNFQFVENRKRKRISASSDIFIYSVPQGFNPPTHQD